MSLSHPLLPPDATKDEKEFLQGSIVNLYKSIEKPEDMFLIAFCYEVGYQKNMAAEILGVSPAAVTFRLEKIRQRLEEGYAKKRLKK